MRLEVIPGKYWSHPTAFIHTIQNLECCRSKFELRQWISKVHFVFHQAWLVAPYSNFVIYLFPLASVQWWRPLIVQIGKYYLGLSATSIIKIRATLSGRHVSTHGVESRSHRLYQWLFPSFPLGSGCGKLESHSLSPTHRIFVATLGGNRNLTWSQILKPLA